MKLVRVPGRDVDYPKVCACCLSPATKTVEIRKEDMKALALALASAAVKVAAGHSAGRAGSLRDSRAVRVPYCNACSAHLRWKRSGGWLGVALHVPVNAFFGLLLGFVVALLFGAAGVGGAEFDVDHPNWLIIGAFVAGGAALAMLTMRWRPRGPLGREHVTDGDAVEIARFTGAEIVLQCRSDRFAEKLRGANPGSAFSNVA
jgi:hypothetical protein